MTSRAIRTTTTSTHSAKRSRRNAKRCAAALVGLQAHTHAKGGESFNPRWIYAEGYIEDLLADLLHLCDKRGLPPFDDCLRRASAHHTTEQAPSARLIRDCRPALIPTIEG